MGVEPGLGVCADVNSFQKMHYLLSCPLESSNDGILDFIQVLDSLSTIHQKIRPSSVRTEAPDLPSFSNIVFILIAQVTSSSFEVITWVYFTL